MRDGAGGGGRTLTEFKLHGILSPARLPVSPLRRSVGVSIVSTTYAVCFVVSCAIHGAHAAFADLLTVLKGPDAWTLTGADAPEKFLNLLHGIIDLDVHRHLAVLDVRLPSVA